MANRTHQRGNNVLSRGRGKLTAVNRFTPGKLSANARMTRARLTLIQINKRGPAAIESRWKREPSLTIMLRKLNGILK